MASPRMIAIACDEACQRIEAWAAVHVDEGLTPLPRVQRDRELLRKNQLTTIADWLERADMGNNSVLDEVKALVSKANWTKAELEAIVLGDN